MVLPKTPLILKADGRVLTKGDPCDAPHRLVFHIRQGINHIQCWVPSINKFYNARFNMLMNLNWTDIDLANVVLIDWKVYLLESSSLVTPNYGVKVAMGWSPDQILDTSLSRIQVAWKIYEEFTKGIPLSTRGPEDWV
jgi:hypothetical protein